ncbi:hypothetical protein IH992_19555 [Candidatus Poribacteria bacterium]|nr:hypothetical protein [Candidatus Poribacteria bacterium]
MRSAASDAVKGMGSAAATPEFLTQVSRLLGDADYIVQRTALEAVGRIMAQGVRIFEAPNGSWSARSVNALSR